jgi:predicted phage tail protein
VNIDDSRTAKSNRPAWAGALIVALLCLVAAVLAAFMGGGLSGLTLTMLGAVLIALVIAGVTAMVRTRK